ncbi:toxin-antitoxin system YwqK family antitoxin [Wenyingzhuangia sp. IMCC45467]
MKKILKIILLLTTTLLYSQTNKFSHCNCVEKLENNNYELKCNNKIIEKGTLINDVKEGEWKTYSRKGKLIRKINYTNGVLNGKVELFNVKGKPKLIGEFKNGGKVNSWTYFTRKGKVLVQGKYEKNIPVGIWTINNKKGKKAVVQYDFTKQEYLLNKETPYHKDGDIIQNDNTEEWYILKSPNKTYSTKSEPLGGYSFANYLFIELVEVPEIFWDTYIYEKYHVIINIGANNEINYKCEKLNEDLPNEHVELTFLSVTNPTSKIKRINFSEKHLDILKSKINEAVEFLPPWINNGSNNEELFIHYVINENMHK